MSTKLCCRCKQTLPLTSFHVNGQRKDGFNSCCKTCRSQTRCEYLGDAEYYKRKSKLWRERNPERYQAALKSHREKNPDQRRNYFLKKNYKLTPEQYKAMLKEQNGRCGCCGCDTPGGRHNVFFVDHCHWSNKVRGLVCQDCNFAVGNMRDSIGSALHVAAYLITTASIESYAETDVHVGDKQRQIIAEFINAGWKRPVEATQ